MAYKLKRKKKVLHSMSVTPFVKIRKELIIMQSLTINSI